jgi:ribonuclease HI
VTYEPDREKAVKMANEVEGMVIATSSSVKSGSVGMGACIRNTLINSMNETSTRYSVTLGTMGEQNPYTAELEAISMALKGIPSGIGHCQIVVISRNLGALTAIAKPRQQSGQATIQQIYDSTRRLRERGNTINMLWAPAHADFGLGMKAKAEAQEATREG